MPSTDDYLIPNINLGGAPVVVPGNPASFFMVWSADGGAPTVRHQTYELARAEAQRLALKHRERKFHILRSVETVEQVVVQTAIVRTSHSC